MINCFTIFAFRFNWRRYPADELQLAKLTELQASSASLEASLAAVQAAQAASIAAEHNHHESTAGAHTPPLLTSTSAVSVTQTPSHHPTYLADGAYGTLISGGVCRPWCTALGDGISAGFTSVAASVASLQTIIQGRGVIQNRGLHSFPFQLNLSSSVHRITQLNS